MWEISAFSLPLTLRYYIARRWKMTTYLGAVQQDSTPMVQLRGVQMFYPPGQAALKNMDLRIERGEFVFVAGVSGAGKSTLLKLLFGAEASTAGQVLVDGRNVPQLLPREVAELRRKLGVVFQDYKLLDRRSVLDNVALTLEVRGVRRSSRLDQARRLLKALGLESKIHMTPAVLSGGEQQRVAIARALIGGPALILADEPTGNLDPEMSGIIFDLLLEANAAGVTVMVATHDLGIIESLNRRTVVLDRGRIIGDFEKPRGAQVA